MRPLTENRRARYDYAILETLEAGIELTGHETKSVKMGRMQIAGSYAIIRGDEAYLIGSEIASFQPNNAPADYDSSRTRRLLLHKREIAKLTGALNEKSISLIPLRAYAKKGFIKIELGLARARKKADKRELLKKRTVEQEMRSV